MFVTFLILTILFNSGNPATSSPTLSPSSLNVPQLIGQLTQCQLQRILTDDLSAVDQLKLQEHSLVGHFFDLPNSDPSIPPGTFSSFHDLTRESLSNTLSVPNLLLPTFALDSVHGANYIPSAILYPHNLALSSSFRPLHAYNSGRSAAIWTSKNSQGVIKWIFSPVIGLATNPLWGRTYETFGESVNVARTFGSMSLSGISSVPGCKGTLKHFVGYSNNEGRDRGYNPSNVATDREWRVWNGTLDKAEAVMTSYTTGNGRASVNWDEPTMRALRR